MTFVGMSQVLSWGLPVIALVVTIYWIASLFTQYVLNACCALVGPCPCLLLISEVRIVSQQREHSALVIKVWQKSPSFRMSSAQWGGNGYLMVQAESATFQAGWAFQFPSVWPELLKINGSWLHCKKRG